MFPLRQDLYTMSFEAATASSGPMEARMPRFLKRRPHRVWLDVVALIVLALVIVLVLELTGTTHIFS